MKKILENLIFIAPILILIYLLYYNYNEFTISQFVLITIFIVTQFYQMKLFKKQMDNQYRLQSKQIKQDVFYRKRFDAIALIFQSVLELNSYSDNLINPLFNRDETQATQNAIKSFTHFVNTVSLYQLYITNEQNQLLIKYRKAVQPLISSCIANGPEDVYSFTDVINNILPKIESNLAETFKNSLHTEIIEK